MRSSRALSTAGLCWCLAASGAPAILELPPDLQVSDVDLPGPAGDRARERIDRLVEVDVAAQRLLEDRSDPLGPDATFQEQAQRMVDHARDGMFVARERAIEGFYTDQQLDQMVMSIHEVLAFDAAQRDPSAPRFVRSPELQARRRQLDEKIEKIRARRAQGLPDEPEQTYAAPVQERRPPRLQTEPIPPVQRTHSVKADLDELYSCE